MKRKSGALLSLTATGMELCWFYAWTSFLMNGVMGLTLSFPTTTGIFLLAAALTSLSKDRGWRIVTLGGMHIVSSACAALFVLHSFYYASYQDNERVLIALSPTTSRTPMEWFYLILLIIWTGLTWYSGTALAGRDKTYTKICVRFDLGLVAFFVLFLTKLALRVKGGMTAYDQVSSALVYPYLLLSFTAIGLARAGREGSIHFLPGRAGTGILMSVLALILVSASSLISFLIPLLTHVAEKGEKALRVSALWILPVVTGVIRFMFMGGNVRPDPPSGPSPKDIGGSASLSGGGWWTDYIEKLFRWGMEVMVLAFSVAIAAVIIFLFLKWLLSRTGINPRANINARTSLPWFAPWTAYLSALWEALKKVLRGYSKASELYSVLSEWGRRSGLPRQKNDTPLEFAARLISRFPMLKTEIGNIISAFNNEVYGSKILSRDQFAMALQSWRALRSPLHWPRRLKARLLSSH